MPLTIQLIVSPHLINIEHIADIFLGTWLTACCRGSIIPATFPLMATVWVSWGFLISRSRWQNKLSVGLGLSQIWIYSWYHELSTPQKTWKSPFFTHMAVVLNILCFKSNLQVGWIRQSFFHQTSFSPLFAKLFYHLVYGFYEIHKSWKFCHTRHPNKLNVITF